VSTQRISLGHGSGGRLTRDLIAEILKPRFENPLLSPLADAALCPPMPNGVAFTTDSFVVSPRFFPGGDIGKLAVAGTVNDLAVVGATPRFLSLALVIEEGLAFRELEQIADSIAATAAQARVVIATGDTKVVEKGKGDGLFINTSGIGDLRRGFADTAPVPGDCVLVSGPVGDHGAIIMSLRSGIDLQSALESDCAIVSPLADALFDAGVKVRCMRDPTRGGLAAVLNEFAASWNLGIVASQAAIPIREQVRGVGELLGIDPLQLACEGRIVAVVPAASESLALEALRKTRGGSLAASIGRIVASHPRQVVLETGVGGRRILDMPEADPLPRIC
jgi:hydrogenase expression/formation protein HypE